ncbi:hypothetical protein [Gloeobacter kilaueensis]|uniref:Uncharacterized protein n=1 Tax=Gloeobacter kilaueensis (strain ATCC BAA-2537 / CCAP 1431/1 / ULC 316 / JS1) TaxID=1183438 RepID=U5QMY8_GLOK1|nr:hypothetical protein [Gloeobacter kilaueensis]AGY60286.1 hypothetical protein GKIL_4040 [Gloeobacter kilaueensis JS1]
MQEGTDQPSRSHEKFSLEKLNQAVQIVAIVAGGAWGIYTFVYRANIAPNLAPPTLSVTNVLTKVGHKGNWVAIRSTVSRSNVGHTGVRVLALTYNAIGVKTRFGKKTATGTNFARIAPGATVVSAARYYDNPVSDEVILHEGVLFEGATSKPSEPSTLNPGERVTRDLIFYVDRSKFDSIRFLVNFYYIRLSEQPLPLALKLDGRNLLMAEPDQTCLASGRCREATITDFATEFSLW